MKKIIFVIALFFATNGIAQTPVDIELILDASGSMESKVGSESQMDIAKRSIKQTIANIPPNVPVAFRVYAHRVPKSNKEESCKDTQLLIPFQPVNAASFSALVDSIQPKGYTPIAYSLKTAAQDFLGKESQHVIILISDGEETCGGDPVAEAKNLLAQGFKVTINTIGFRADEKTRAQLSAIANATGGSYFDAKDAPSLTQNLTQATQKALLLNKPAEKARGQEIRGGNAYQDAKPLQTGVEYRLDHHQKMDQYDYFYVDLKKGDALTITMSTMDKGINISEEGKPEENDDPNAGFRIMNSQFDEVLKDSIHGRHQSKDTTVVSNKEERFYILMGTDHDNVHKDSPFQIHIKQSSDANTGKDAGDDITQATPINVADYPENWLANEEDTDYFVINAKAGEPYSVMVTPKIMTSDITVRIFDGDRVELLSETSPSPGATVRLENIVPKTNGPLYIKVTGWNFEKPNQYALSLKGASSAEGVTPPPTTGETPATTPVATAIPDNAAKTKQLYGMLAIGGLAFGGILVIVALVLLLKKKKPN